MRRSYGFFVMLSLPAFTAAIGCLHDTGPHQDANEPAFWIDRAVRDMGDRFLSNESMTVDFAVENRRSQPIHVVEIRPSCGCTTVSLGSHVLPAHSSTTLSLSTDLDLVGRHSTAVTLRTDEAGDANYRVELHWNGVAPIEVDQNRIEFGKVRPDSDVARSVRLELRKADCRITGMTALPNELSLGDLRIVDGAVELPIRLRAAKDPGVYRGRLFVAIENGWPKELEIPVGWTIGQAVEATPARTFLGSAKPGERLIKSIIVASDDDFPVKILDLAQTGMEGLTLEPTSTEPGSMTVKLTWQAPHAAGVHSAEITMTVEGLDQPLVCSAFGFVLEE